MGQTTLKQLVDVGALNPSHGWSHAYVDNVVWTQVLAPIMSDPATLAVVTAVEAGIAICQALLMAVDLGLGTGINAFNGAKASEIFGVPAHLIPLWVQLVGYPAESPDAGGQRPRQPFEELYFEGRCGHPIGATGAAQIVELTWQLEGRCGQRQVADASVALAQNAGGWIGTDAAACAVHVLQRWEASWPTHSMPAYSAVLYATARNPSRTGCAWCSRTASCPRSV